MVKAGARRKGFDCDVDRLLELDRQRRDLTYEIENMRAKRNAGSKQIPKLKGEEKAKALADMKELSTTLKKREPELRAVEEEVNELLLTVPQPPAEGVPDGESEEDNVEVQRWGEPPEFDFQPRDHVELGEMLDIIDIPRGVKLAGQRCYVLKNEGARLEIAVLNFAFDYMLRQGFTPLIVPVLVREDMMVGTGYFPIGRDQTYAVPEDERYLVGTAEVSLTAYYADEILNESDLPVKLVAWSSCFRREAGTYGKDTRGLYRIHQFQKVEQVILCRNDEEESRHWHERILGNAEAIVQALELPYRIVAVCTGDLGVGQVRKNDIECWMPSRGGYGETHSCSTLYEFQSRRLKIRYRDSDGNTRLVHTLNNTVLASPRILITLLECNQQADGSVVIPEVLRPYMGGQELIEPKQ